MTDGDAAASLRGAQRRSNPALHKTRYAHEATRRLHHGKSPERHGVRRCHFKPASASMVAPHSRCCRLHVALWMQDARLVRDTRDHAGCHSPRKADQGRIKKKEACVNRGSQPELARLVRGDRLTPVVARSVNDEAALDCFAPLAMTLAASALHLTVASPNPASPRTAPPHPSTSPNPARSSVRTPPAGRRPARRRSSRSDRRTPWCGSRRSPRR